MSSDKRILDFFQAAVGYSNEEMAEFRADPKSEKLLAAAGKMGATRFVAEVVDAHGCFSGHAAGQKIVLDGAGNLTPGSCPERTCIYLLSALTPLIFAAQELMYAGAEPDLLFNRCSCIDVGRSCGGLGRVVLELQTGRSDDPR